MIKKYIITPLILIVLCIGLFLSPIWDKVEILELDLLNKFQSTKNSKELTIVNLTNDYFNKISTDKIPLNNSLLEILSEINNQNPQLIIFRSPGKEIIQIDSNLKKFISLNNIIFSYPNLENSENPDENFEIPLNTSTKNNKIYYYPLYKEINSQKVFSLGIKAINFLEKSNKRPKINFTNVEIGNYKIKKNYKNKIFLKNYNDIKLKKTNAIDFLNNKIPENLFKNKIVIIGKNFNIENNKNFKNINNEPISQNEIHAHFLTMYLNDDFISNIPYIRKLILILLIVFLGFIVFAHIELKKSIPISLILIITIGITSYKLYVESNVYLEVIDFIFVLILSNIVGAFSYRISLKRKIECLERSFGNKINSQSLESLKNHPNSIKNEIIENEITVILVAIPNYFDFIKTLSAKFSVNIIKEYYAFTRKIIKQNGGYIENEKDGEIRAIFGFPNEDINHTYHACKTALNLKNDLSKLNTTLKKNNLDEIEDIHIAIDTNTTAIGNTLTKNKWKFNAFGKSIAETQNNISRIKNYKLKNKIILNELSYEKAKEKIIAKKIDMIKSENELEISTLYELCGIKE